MGGAGRVALAATMSEDAWAITRSGIASRHPSYSADEVRFAELRMRVGDASGMLCSCAPFLPRRCSHHERNSREIACVDHLWLDDAGIPFMVAGSWASTYHGHPRTTQDVDIVIDPTREALLRFLAAVPAERAYVDRTSAMEAFDHRDMFNVIDMETGWKIDLILRKPRPFSKAEFERRNRADWLGVRTYVASAEDVILSKLEWAKLSGGSERQIGDVVGVIEMRGEQLDRAHIEHWLDDLGVRDLGERALLAARPTT
jgi:hypothetical protein